MEKDIRSKWEIGNHVEVYLKSRGEWLPAKICEIYIDNNTEWLTCCIAKKLNMNVQRYDRDNIRPCKNTHDLSESSDGSDESKSDSQEEDIFNTDYHKERISRTYKTIRQGSVNQIMKGFIDCFGSSMNNINGMYSVKRKAKNGSFIFINTSNPDIIIKKQSGVHNINTKTIETSIDEKREINQAMWYIQSTSTKENYYCAKAINNKVAEFPTQLKWEGMISNTKPDHINIRMSKQKIRPQSKPKITKVVAKGATLSIYYRCKRKKPDNCLHIRIWTEIVVKHFDCHNDQKMSRKPNSVMTYQTNAKLKSFSISNHLIEGDEYEFIVRMCNDLFCTDSDPYKLSLKRKTYPIITCEGADISMVNGTYSVYDKKFETLSFIHHKHPHLKIMRAYVNKYENTALWVLCDSVKQQDYYTAEAFAHDKLPPKIGWQSEKSNDEYSSVTISISEKPLKAPPKPKILKIQPIPNALQLHFECNESLRKPEGCPFMKVWYEIEISKNNLDDEKKQTHENVIFKTTSSPFKATELENDVPYIVSVRTCNTLLAMRSDISEFVIPLMLPPKADIINVNCKSGEIMISFECIEANVDNFFLVTCPPVDCQHKAMISNKNIMIRENDLAVDTKYDLIVASINQAGVTYSESESIYYCDIEKKWKNAINHYFPSLYNGAYGFYMYIGVSDIKTIKNVHNNDLNCKYVVKHDNYESANDTLNSGTSSFDMPKPSKSLLISSESSKFEYETATIDTPHSGTTSFNMHEPSKSAVLKHQADIKQCKAVKQIMNALKYYQTWTSKPPNYNTLYEYCTDKFSSLLDDYNHIIEVHHDHTETIYDIIMDTLGVCNFNNCAFVERHHRNRNDEANQLETSASFWTNTLDSIHFYFFHLYDFNYRTKSIEMQKKTINNNANNNKKSQSKTTINRVDNSNKFSLDISTSQNNIGTYIDGLYAYLDANLIKLTELQLIQNFLQEEEYDTEALKAELEIYDTEAFIIYSFNKEIVDCMKEYDNMNQMHESSFNIGFNFYYWCYYQSETKEDSNGFAPFELYISKKYSNMKYEVLNNTVKTLSLNKYETAFFKAKVYLATQRARNTTADVSVNNNLHCGMKRGTPYLMRNLLSVIFYTDYSELSSAFSTTFRRLEAHEPLSSIKKRNKEYWWWSKTLRETVEYYGKDRWNYGSNNGIQGPFYTGLSFECALSEFDIKLCCPSSTSMKKEVAWRFAGDAGLIIELNNDIEKWSKCLRCYDCSWISRFKEEDERLFFGAKYRMRVSTVRIIKTNTNYELFIKPLYYLDCMVNGTEMDPNDPPNITSKDHTILSRLIKHEITNQTKNIYEEYVHNTFKVWCNQKTRIIIDLFYLHTSFFALKQLIISDENLINSDILKLFKNIDAIIIHSASNYYAFDLKGLAMVLEHHTQKRLQITIKSGQTTDDETSWFDGAINTSVKKHFNEKSFQIYPGQHCLKIHKIQLYRVAKSVSRLGYQSLDNEVYHGGWGARYIVDYYANHDGDAVKKKSTELIQTESPNITENTAFFKVLVCQRAGIEKLNGKYSVEGKRNGALLFAKNDNQDIKIMRDNKGKWVFREINGKKKKI
eukprot:183054_1